MVKGLSDNSNLMSRSIFNNKFGNLPPLLSEAVSNTTIITICQILLKCLCYNNKSTAYMDCIRSLFCRVLDSDLDAFLLFTWAWLHTPLLYVTVPPLPRVGSHLSKIRNFNMKPSPPFLCLTTLFMLTECQQMIVSCHLTSLMFGNAGS